LGGNVPTVRAKGFNRNLEENPGHYNVLWKARGQAEAVNKTFWNLALPHAPLPAKKGMPRGNVEVGMGIAGTLR